MMNFMICPKKSNAKLFEKGNQFPKYLNIQENLAINFLDPIGPF
jgi:hypothetical protein